MMAELPPLLEPVSELGVVKPELYEKLLAGQAIENIILTSD